MIAKPNGQHAPQLVEPKLVPLQWYESRYFGHGHKERRSVIVLPQFRPVTIHEVNLNAPLALLTSALEVLVNERVSAVIIGPPVFRYTDKSYCDIPAQFYSIQAHEWERLNALRKPEETIRAYFEGGY